MAATEVRTPEPDKEEDGHLEYTSHDPSLDPQEADPAEKIADDLGDFA